MVRANVFFEVYSRGETGIEEATFSQGIREPNGNIEY
jgi:hypothetical protein